jgi:hypothetical protein
MRPSIVPRGFLGIPILFGIFSLVITLFFAYRDGSGGVIVSCTVHEQGQGPNHFSFQAFTQSGVLISKCRR